jgi:hypothetical protein
MTTATSNPLLPAESAAQDVVGCCCAAFWTRPFRPLTTSGATVPNADAGLRSRELRSVITQSDRSTASIWARKLTPGNRGEICQSRWQLAYVCVTATEVVAVPVQLHRLQ